MFKKGNVKSFIAGACLATVVTGAFAVFAETTNIQVTMKGIKVYWDGVERELTNVDGVKVEPILYDGTTYVPVRAMSNLAGKTVDWDEEKQAVIIGKPPVAETTFLKDMQERIVFKINGGRIEEDYDGGEFILKNKKYQYNNALYAMYSNNDKDYNVIIYDLDGQFKEVVGKAVSGYTEMGSDGTGVIQFYSIKDDGTEERLIKQVEVNQTMEPEDIAVDVEGVINLKIVISNSAGYKHEFHTYFYDVSFLSE